MQLPQTVELKGIRVLTSKQLALCYETTTDRIKQNFKENRERFVERKHYISLTGDDLKAFKNEVTKNHLVEKNQVGISDLVGNRASHLYLWTEKGALLHAKSLNTDKAWEVYDYLVDFYFRVKEQPQSQSPELQICEESCETPAKIEGKVPKQAGFDIAPAFREIISMLPIEALDSMEQVLRNDRSRAIKLAGMAVLAEKMKRQIN